MLEVFVVKRRKEGRRKVFMRDKDLRFLCKEGRKKTRKRQNLGRSESLLRKKIFFEF